MCIRDSGTLSFTGDYVKVANLQSYVANTNPRLTTLEAGTFTGDITLGDDIFLDSDSSVIHFGDDGDVTLTHVADTGLLLNSTRQLQFGDSGTYIHQSADGVLDLVSDTEIEINATTIDVNGNLDVSGTLTQGGASQFNSTITVGVDDTGYDVKFFGDTASAYMLWDASADDLILGGAARLGIGTTSPTAPLDVRGYVSDVGIIYGNAGAASQYLMTLTDGVATNFSIVTAGAVLTLGSDAGSTQTALKSTGTERMRLDASGNVVVGTTSASARLHTNGAANSRAFHSGSTQTTVDSTQYHNYIDHNTTFSGSATPTADRISYGLFLDSDFSGTFGATATSTERFYNRAGYIHSSASHSTGVLYENDGLLVQTLDQGTGSATVDRLYGILNYTYDYNDGAKTNQYAAINGSFKRAESTGTTTTLTGSSNYAYTYDGAGPTTYAYGAQCNFSKYDSSTTGTAAGVRAYISGSGTGTISSGYGLLAQNYYTSGTITNSYGVYTTGFAREHFGGSVGIGTTSPDEKLEVYGNAKIGDTSTAYLYLGDDLSTGSAALEIGTGRSGSGYSYIDLVGDTTYTDYGLRIIRDNSGANAPTTINHRGTGLFTIKSTEAADIAFQTTNATRMIIDSGGDVGIGTTSPNQALTIGQDSAQATLELRRTNAVSGAGQAYGSVTWAADDTHLVATLAAVSDNADGNGADFIFMNTSDASSTTNYSVMTEKMRLTSAGNVGIGDSSPSTLLHVTGTDSTALIRLESTSVGASSFDGSGAGLELIAAGMNTSSKYTPAIKFGSTDPAFTTTNPKFGAAIIAESTQTYNSDTKGGMDLSFWTSPNDPGTGHGLVQRMVVRRDGAVGIGTTAPGAGFQLEVKADDTTTGGQVFINQAGTGDPGLRFSTAATSYMIGVDNSDSDTFKIDYGTTGVGAQTGISINTSGLIGFGTGSPTEELHIYATAPTIRLEDSQNNLSGYINGDNGNVLLQSHNINRDIIFGENAASGEFARIVGVGGKVGIGTSSPSEKLHVVDGGGSDAEMILETSTDSTGARIHLKSPNATGANYHTIGSMNASTANWRIGGSGTADTIDFQVGSGYTQIMRVNSTGLGIGTTSPGVELHISSAQPEVRLQDSDGTDQYGQMYQAGGVTYFLTRNNTSNGQFYFNLYDGTTLSTKMVIDSSGRVGIGTTSPGHELALVGDYQPLRVDSTTSSTAMIRLDHNGTIKSYWGASGGYQLILSNASAANQYYFRDLNGYSRFQILASTTGGGSPGGAKLDALGSAAASPPVIASIDMTLTDDTDGSEDGAIAFYTAANGTNAEHIRLNTSGNVGVGTTSPSAKLDVSGEVQGTSGFYVTDGYSATGYTQTNTTDHGQYQAGFTDRHGSARASFEWGHSNGDGYGCTLACTNGGGAPYIGFNCGPGTVNNTWRTFGQRGLALLVSHGVMYFYDVADAGSNGVGQNNQGTSGTADKEGTDSASRITLNSTNGNASFGGALSKGSGSFLIEHPLDSKKDTHNLAHSFIEGPQADLIYRGKVVLSSGAATVNIDTSAGMTSGTFEALCTDVQCFTSNETGWTAVKGSVSGATLTIQAQDNSCTDTISWMVVGERKDKHMFDTDWTDDNGKVIVEPLKPEPVKF